MPLRVLESFLKSLGRLKGRRLAVAVSGGADSLCLLAGLAQLRGAFGYRLGALHCQHGLRGAASRGDEAAVRALCKKLGVPLRVFRKRIGAGAGVEERAREWRRQCYARAGAPVVFLAHHAWDQAETVLLNLIRGAGLAGAGGMRPLAPLAKGVTLARPWLEVEPARLRGELKRRGIRWREDASNRRLEFKRNALRHRVLPELERILPGAALRMAGFARRAGEAQGLLDAMLKAELRKARDGSGWSLAVIKEMAPALRRLALRKLGGPSMDEAAVARAEALVLGGKGGIADLRRGNRLQAKRGRLFRRK